jgi:hypothetical protein
VRWKYLVCVGVGAFAAFNVHQTLIVEAGPGIAFGWAHLSFYVFAGAAYGLALGVEAVEELRAARTALETLNRDMSPLSSIQKRLDDLSAEIGVIAQHYRGGVTDRSANSG